MEKHLGVEKPKAAEPGRAVWAGNAGRERIKGRSLRLEGPGRKKWAEPGRTVAWHWANFLTCLSLGFCICKVGTIIEPPQRTVLPGCPWEWERRLFNFTICDF